MSAQNEVKVYVRIRPTEQFAQELIKISTDKQTVHMRHKKNTRKALMNSKMSSWIFRLNGVLHMASQEEVYQQVAHDVVLGALKGYNGTVMSFGQTGAGKTFTMTGVMESYKQRGIIPRAIQEVFHEIDNRVDHSFSVHLSFLEIYNETLVDLLVSVKGEQTKDCRTLSVVEDPEGRVSVKGLSLHPVHGEEEALNLLFEGEMNKMIGEHDLNRNSSRSHCIFTLHIQSHSRTLSNATYVMSKLNLVDLAGSERLKKTGSEGQVQREAMYINKSLSFLEQTILALTDRHREHVPFRQSKLTHALKDSLGGNCNTVLVANIHGEAAQIDETLSTLNFAARMKRVCTEPSVNKYTDLSLQVQSLQKEIQLLKQELSFHNTLTNQAAVTYEDLSETEVARVKSEVQRYLDDTLDEITIVNIQQIWEVFAQFKKAFKEQEQQNKELKSERCERCAVTEKNQKTFSTSDTTEAVEEEKECLNRLGVSASSQRQFVSPSRTTSKKVQESSGKNCQGGISQCEQLSMTQSETEVLVLSGADESKGSAKDIMNKRCDTPQSKMEAFEVYKLERGHEITCILKKNMSVLKERLEQRHRLIWIMKSIKQDINHTISQLQLYTDQSQGQTVSAESKPVLEESRAFLLTKLREAKDQHRQICEEWLSTDAEVRYCRHLVEKCRVRLFTEFESWYNESFLLPDEILTIFKDGGPIRPDLVPVDKALVLEDDGRKPSKHSKSHSKSSNSISFPSAYNKTVQKETPHTFTMRKHQTKLKSLSTVSRNESQH